MSGLEKSLMGQVEGAAEEQQPEGAERDPAAAGQDGWRPRRYNRRMQDGQGSTIWILSFTDIMALMLTFFVLLYAMREPESEDFQEMSAALRKEFSVYQGRPLNRGQQDTIDVAKINYSRALNLNYLQALMTRLLADEPELSGVGLTPQPGRLVLSLPQDLLFGTGSAEVTEKGSKALFALGGALSRVKNRIEVLGHADPRQIQGQGGPYKSNWDLSLARAVSVAAILQSVGYENPLVVRGLGSAAYDDLPETMDPEKRLAVSRRVDIVLLEDDGSLSVSRDLSIQ